MDKQRRHRRSPRKRPAALPVLVLVLAAAAPAAAGPSGEQLVGGSAIVSRSGTTTTIDQTSDKAILNWDSFSIGGGETTRFNQPGRGSIALNRVTGGDASAIDGQLLANGGVWLVNPNGVFFGAGSRVDVHSLIATTANILDSDFLADRYAFGAASPNPDAGVVNQGTLTVGAAGLAALVAPHVRNDGVINGRLGQVILAGVPTFTLDLAGDGLVQFAATSAVTAAPAGAGALVENTGTIQADGGSVRLTAAAASGVIDTVINTSGVIEARGIAEGPGGIVLDGGGAGRVVVAGGRLDAGAAEAGAAAGSIAITGAKVVVEPAATLATDASGSGDGGEIALKADAELAFAGRASARGGAVMGDGGSVLTETIARDARLLATGRVDTTAAAGRTGTWFITHADNTHVHANVVYDPAKGGAGKYPAHRATVAADAINQSPTRVSLKARDLVLINAAVATNEDIGIDGQFVTLKQSLSTTGTVRIVGKFVRGYGDAVISAARLDLSSRDHTHPVGDVILKTDVDELAIGASATGQTRFNRVEIRNQGDLTVGQIDASGIDVGSLLLEVDGTLNVLRPIRAQASGDALVIVTDRFVNGVGAEALQAPQGRWLVYSVDPVTDERGGAAGEVVFNRDFDSSPPESLGVSGNAFVYSRAPASTPAAEPAPASPAAAAAVPPSRPSLTAQQFAEATQATTIPFDDAAESAALADVDVSRLVTMAPAAEASDDDLLFANDGNRALWGLSGGR